LLGISSQAVALEEPPQVRFVVKEFVVTGDNPLSDTKTRSILDKFTGEHDGLEGLQAAADEFESTLRKNGFSFYRVSLVPQALEAGIITFEVSEFKINNIVVEGNKHYSETNILNNAPSLKQGEAPNTSILSRAINMANNKPAKNLTLRFSESETGGAIDAKLIVKDDVPDFFFTNINNTGSSETGRLRITGGYQFTNLFDKDHNFSLSYTTSPDNISAVSQIGLAYSIPDYATGSRFDILVSDSNVDSGLIGGTVDVSGKGTVISLRYNKIFLQSGSYKQDIDIGLDHKKFDDDVIFGGFNSGKKIVSRPLSVAYKGSRLSTSGSLDFSIGFASNISGGSKNEDADYAASRTGKSAGITTTASADWSKFNYHINYLHFLENNWLLRFNLVGQEASEMLISGELFGVGGSGSVRGFAEREILGDKGYQINLEIWMPTVTEYEIRPILFYDLGHTETLDPDTVAGVKAEEDPASFGAGLRYSWLDKLSMVLDAAYVSAKGGSSIVGDTRIHFNLSYSF